MGKKNKNTYPMVSLCTPTFNRRPFVPMMLQCFNHQTYPKDKIEWIIVDDGTDKIEDLVSHIPQVKYIKLDEKITLGKKRNMCNDMAKGDIIIYMDDDDYYPPERISHAVKTLQDNPKALCAGSSAMYIYFKHINKMYQFGPYGENHSTAATFAFRKELLRETRFNEGACLAEEKLFLKNYTIPFVQLDPKKSILVFSHIHNSFDKKILLENRTHVDSRIHETTLLPKDIVNEPEILKFFMEDIDHLLDEYEQGKPYNKPDVLKQINEINEIREKHIQEMQNKQKQYADTINKLHPKSREVLIQENATLRENEKYLQDKIKQLIRDNIELKKQLVLKS